MNVKNIVLIGHSLVLAINRSPFRELAKRHDVMITVLSPDKIKGSLRDIEVEPEPLDSRLKLITVRTLLCSPPHLLVYSPRSLKRALDQVAPIDLIHVWAEAYTYSAFQVFKYASKRGLRASIYVNQNIIKRYPPPFSFFERKIIKNLSGWAGGGQLVFDCMKERGYPESLGAVIGFAFDSKKFFPRSEVFKEKFKERLGFEPGVPLIGFMGRLVAEKGITVLQEALGLLSPAMKWNLLIMGSGPLKQELETWRDNLRGDHTIKIELFSHDEVADGISACDFLVAPSRSYSNWKEQFGRMLIEAFACGVPVITSDSGEIPYTCAGAAIICKESSADQFARAIELLLTQPEELRRWKELGLKRAQVFTSAAIGDRYMDFFEKSLAH